ncbi:MAG: hypothetical protein JNK68_10540 [Betaproteobacteria bacterium]|nr:hypothetical protein [Betaproteobacteria bacterium]
MLHLFRPALIGLVSVAVMLVSLPARAVGQTADDPWPRAIDLGGGATATLYQPQVESWSGNRLSLRMAVGVSGPGANESFGTVWATAVTRVDRASRLVSLDDVSFTRAALPSPTDRGTTHLDALQAQLQRVPQTIALDRLQASVGVTRSFKPAGLAVQNTPPRIFVSDAPARLVTIAGSPVLRQIPGTPFDRVINTRALLLRDARSYYLLLADGWMTAEALDGSWYPAERVPPALERVAAALAVGTDVPAGGIARSARDGAPTVFVSQTPAALVVFEGGERVFDPIAGTTLLRAANTPSNLIVDIVSGQHYLLLAGRWFRAPALNGPWSHVSARTLPRDFAAIPADDPAGAVLASVAGTPQAQQSLIDDATPQTATVPRTNGPTFTAEFDGHPQYRPIAGTPLSYVANSATPIIRVDGRRYCALKAGVWFEASSVFGPWAVAAAVPDIVYTIPTSSPLHHVTYVRVYGATSQVVDVGYTPGYAGSVVSTDGVVVEGTGYVYPGWIGSAYFPSPMTYGGTPARRDEPDVYAQWGGAVYAGLRGHRYLASSAPRALLIESLGAAGGDNDHYAEANGAVWRYRNGDWEKLDARGWERVAPESCAWAISEREARASGAQRFERQRAKEGADHFADVPPDAGRSANAVAAGNAQVGTLRARRTAP